MNEEGRPIHAEFRVASVLDDFYTTGGLPLGNLVFAGFARGLGNSTHRSDGGENENQCADTDSWKFSADLAGARRWARWGGRHRRQFSHDSSHHSPHDSIDAGSGSGVDS